MPLTTDWKLLQAAITEYDEDATGETQRTVVVLSLPVSGSTARASTAVAASLLRGLVNDYFETYEIPVHSPFTQITKIGTPESPDGYSLAIYLHAATLAAYSVHAAAVRTAVEQALEDLPKNLDRPDADTARIIEALATAERLEDPDA